METFKAEDTWILSRLNSIVQDFRSAIDSYRLNEACRIVYDFTWHDYCDWYVEAKKADLYQDEDPARKENALNLCSYLLAYILKLLHPIMPFITEEIWGYLREKVFYPGVIDNESILKETLPQAEKTWIDNDIVKKFSLLQDVIIALRTIRSENNVPPEKKGSSVIIPPSLEEVDWLTSQIPLINLFAKLDTTSIDCNAAKPGFAGQGVVKGIQVYLALEGLIDRDVEIERLSKEITHLEKIAAGTKKRLENDSFVKKAPEAVVTKEKEKYQGILVNLEKLQMNLKEIKR